MKGAELEARAFAKINLGLEVLGKREDGYHELRTILQTVDFYDRLRFVRDGNDVRLVTNVPELSGEANLVMRAARKLAQRAALDAPGATIHLDKRIPAGMGLGGGSSDAAVALMALARLWGLKLSRPDLHEIASELGMDVPFFLYGGAAVAVGAGDEVYPLALPDRCPLVLILPDFSISTGDAYSRLRLTTGGKALTLQHFAWSRPTLRDTPFELVNHLEGATGEHASKIEGFKRSLIDLGARGAMMSGSGAAVFGLFPTESTATQAADSLRESGVRAIATRTIGATTYGKTWLTSGA